MATTKSTKKRTITEKDKLSAVSVLLGEIEPNADVYVIEGNDNVLLYRVQEYLQSVLLRPEQADFDLDVIECDKGTSLDSILMELGEFPVLGEKRLLILREAHNLSASLNATIAEAFERYLAQHCTSVIISCSNVTADSLANLALRANNYTACAISCKLNPQECQQWIEFLLHQKGLTFSASLPREIAERVGNNSQFLVAQLDSLAHYVGERTEITSQDVQRLIPPCFETKAYELTKAIDNRNRNQAWKIAENLLSETIEVQIAQNASGGKSTDISIRSMGIISYLNTYLCSLAHLHSLVNAHGTQIDKLTPYLKGKKDFQIRNDLKNLSTWSEPSIRSALCLLCDADHYIKTGRDPRLTLDLLIANLCQRSMR